MTATDLKTRLAVALLEDHRYYIMYGIARRDQGEPAWQAHVSYFDGVKNRCPHCELVREVFGAVA